MKQPFMAAGFDVEIEQVEVKSSLVLIIVAKNMLPIRDS
jgi:hypothetical protein